VRGIDLVKRLGWQNVRERRDYFTALIVYKSLNGMAPVYLTDMFTYSNAINTVNTRSSTEGELYIQKANKHIFEQSLGYSGSKLWNTLSPSTRNACSLNVFKQRVKEL
jgi:hypothetical protein